MSSSFSMEWWEKAWKMNTHAVKDEDEKNEECGKRGEWGGKVKGRKIKRVKGNEFYRL